MNRTFVKNITGKIQYSSETFEAILENRSTLNFTHFLWNITLWLSPNTTVVLRLGMGVWLGKEDCEMEITARPGKN